jgi:arylsulfatase A-like enzyme
MLFKRLGAAAVALAICMGAALTLIGSSTTKAFANAGLRERPNIVFVLVDDLGWGDVAYHNSEIATPNIDALASQGVRLERAYAFPICSPTRAALMTGRTPLQFGVDDAMENDAMLPEQLTLLPEYFQRSGYATWMVGKWHLGMGRVAALPQSRGFDYFYGHLGGFIDYYTHVYFGGLDWQRQGKSIRETGHATDLLTQDAVRLLTEHDRQKPFFLYLAYNAPHTPLQVLPTDNPTYLNIGNADRRVFAQMTTQVDEAIGRVLGTLERLGLRDNTIVVFMSDNGGNLEAGASNGMLRGGKGSAHEGGTRVPAVIAWPQGLKGGRTSKVHLFAQDWLPTLLDAAGIAHSVDAFDGRSAWPSLARNKDAAIRRPTVIGVKQSKAVFDGRWKLVREGTASDQLYDIESDPQELLDRAKRFPATVRRLAAILDALPVIDSRGARGPRPETLFRDASGKFDYRIRMPETRKPWAESVLP